MALLAEQLGLLCRELAVGEDALAVQLAELGQQADALRPGLLSGTRCRLWLAGGTPGRSEHSSKPAVRPAA